MKAKCFLFGHHWRKWADIRVGNSEAVAHYACLRCDAARAIPLSVTQAGYKRPGATWTQNATVGSLILSVALLGLLGPSCGAPRLEYQDLDHMVWTWEATSRPPTAKEIEAGAKSDSIYWDFRAKSSDPGHPSVSSQSGSVFWWVPWAVGGSVLLAGAYWYLKRK